jgi:Conserved hypothetical protein 2217 (DUF2460)
MSNAVYPANVRGLGFTTLKTSKFATVSQSSPGFNETRIAQTANPRWSWSLIYNYMKNSPYDLVPGYNYPDYQILAGFILARQGKFDSFLWNDPYDNTVGPALLTGGIPNPAAQLQVVQDPTTGIYYSPIQRSFGGQYYEDITDLQASGIAIYANGALMSAPTNYSLGGPGLAIPGNTFQGLYAQWVAAPATPVTAQFNFYFRVRFDSDDQDIEQFMQFLWTIGGPDASQGEGYLKFSTVKTENLL